MPDRLSHESSSDELATFLSGMAYVLPNLTDTFGLASADTEQISVGDGQALADFWRAHGWHGMVALAAIQRGAAPLTEVAGTTKYQQAWLAAVNDGELLDETEVLPDA